MKKERVYITANTGKRKNTLSIEDKQAILLEYELNHTNSNIQAICNKYQITRQTIYDLIKKKEENSIIDYQSNFTKKANEIIALMLDRLENELKTSDKINISQLSTSLGILYDKARLNDNKSTSNSSININIKIE